MTDRKKFSRTAIDQIMRSKSLSAANQRRGFARASSAKRFILSIIAPELLEVRTRLAALEKLVISMADLKPYSAEDLKTVLKVAEKEALEALPEDDKLSHLANPDISPKIWKSIEDAMVRDIEQKQRKPLLDSAGVEESQ
tara:strand:- start:460 stop:879 length:420 start_codon:yes stop_codon:yes gene_type:complete